MEFDRGNRGNRPLSSAFVVVGLAGTLLLGGIGGARPARAQETVNLTPEQRSAATALEGAFMRIADTVGPATVRITAVVVTPAPTLRRRSGNGSGSGSEDPGDDSDGQADSSTDPFQQFFGRRGFTLPQARRVTSGGSGVIVRPEGWIVTNDHVVEDAQNNKVKVTLSDNSEYTGTIYRDFFSDLAVVKIDAGHPLPYVKMAEAKPLRVGQWAIAIGSPFEQQNTMTTGIVSALHRRRQIPDEDGGTTRFYSDLIQTDASINPGNSGGPLLNIDGELIGVNTAIVSLSNSSAGIGFAIPTSTVQMVVDQLIKKGKVTRSYLGVEPVDIPVALRRRIGTQIGAYVSKVESDTPADKAGIQPGDVITQFNGLPVGDEVSLRNAIAATTPETLVPISLLREGKTVALKVALKKGGEAPERAPGNAGTSEAPRVPTVKPARRVAAELGINGRSLTAVLIEQYNLPTDTKGVLVTAVLPGSPASDAGLVGGFAHLVITTINGTPIATPDALNAAMANAKSGDVYTLTVLIPDNKKKPARQVVNIQVP